MCQVICQPPNAGTLPGVCFEKNRECRHTGTLTAVPEESLEKGVDVWIHAMMTTPMMLVCLAHLRNVFGMSKPVVVRFLV